MISFRVKINRRDRVKERKRRKGKIFIHKMVDVEVPDYTTTKTVTSAVMAFIRDHHPGWMVTCFYIPDEIYNRASTCSGWSERI